MPYKEERISLQGFLVWIPLKSLVRKTLIRKRYIHLATCLLSFQVEYETGAVLGRAMLDKLDILKKMLTIPGVNKYKYGQVIKDAQEAAKKRLDEFKNEHGYEPQTFSDFIYWPLWETATGLSFGELFKPEHVKNRERTRKRLLRIIQKKLGQKVSVEEAQPAISNFLLEGIGFGSAFPALTEKIYKSAYETVDVEWQAIRRAHPALAGKMDKIAHESASRLLGIPSSDLETTMTLKEREDIILQAVATYTAEFYPELLDALDLRGYIDTEGSR